MAAKFGLTLARPQSAVTLCLCSATSRGYPSVEKESVARRVQEAYDEYLGQSWKNISETSRLTRLLRQAFYEGREKFGMEGMVNFDAAVLRKQGPGICVFANDTGLNVPFFNRTGDAKVSCEAEAFASSENQRAQFIGVGERLTTVAPPRPPPSNSPAPSPKISIRNEGCVAAEHLEGHTMQHATHWLRPVLCARGFCATENHAIIFEGQWTSMRRLCDDGALECTTESRLVNNLKISRSRRVQFDDTIVITPYDARFPKWCVWLVQMAEDMVSLLSVGLHLGFSLSVLIWVHALSKVIPVASAAITVASIPTKRTCACEARAYSMHAAHMGTSHKASF